MPRVPAPPTAADGAAFALSDIRWPGWMWCSNNVKRIIQGKVRYAVRAETHDGFYIILSHGFRFKREAEAFRIRLANYKRVWVEPINGMAIQSTL